MKEYYIIDINNEQQGPIDEESLRADFEQSFYGPDTMAWTQGMPSWKPLSAIFGNTGTNIPPPPMPKQRGSVLIVSTDSVMGYSKGTSLGLVSANVVMSRNVAVDAIAVTKSLFGGEVPQHTKLMNDARDEAIQRIKKQASRMGADAICGFRLTSSDIMQEFCEICVYGTAVKLEEN